MFSLGDVGWRSVSQPRRLWLWFCAFTEKSAMQKRQIGNNVVLRSSKPVSESPLSQATPPTCISRYWPASWGRGERKRETRRDKRSPELVSACEGDQSEREERVSEPIRGRCFVVIILERQDPVVATLCVNPNRIGQKYARVWGEGGVYR